MVLNEEMLKKTKVAAEAFNEAERKADIARAEYHTHLRRLHLASGSLREVAQAVGLSHQRVQQIINGAGGTWWSRIWKSRSTKRDAICTFCERPPSEVSSLVAGPNVFICDSCIELAEKAAEGKPGGQPAFRKVGSEKPKLKCSFCGKPKDQTRPMITSLAGQLCGECLGICRDILIGQTPQPR